MDGITSVKDGGLVVREVSEFPSGVTNNGRQGFVDPVTLKKFVRTKKSSKYYSGEIGVFADGTNYLTRLQNAFNDAKIKEIILDADEGGGITLTGTLTVPAGKKLSFRDGTYLTGTCTLTGTGYYFAPEYSKAFDTNVTVSGLKPVLGKLSPFNYGAVGDDATNDQPAFQKLFNHLATLTDKYPKVNFPPAKYYVSATTDLPGLLINGTYVIPIEGNGCQVRTDGGIPIFRRMPTDQTNAMQIISNWIGIIKDFQFRGTSIYGATVSGQQALKLGALYSWKIENCVFDRFHDPIEIQFGLNCEFNNLRFGSNTNTGFYGRYGTWSGADKSNSAFNANVFSKCRWFMANGSFTSAHLQGADQNAFYDCVSEGFNPQYNFYLDYDLSTNVNYTHFENTWIESSGGVNTTNTIFYIKHLGTFYCKNLQRIYPNILFERPEITTGSAGRIVFDGMPYDGNMPSGVRYNAGGITQTGNTFIFTNMPNASTIASSVYDTTKWTGGVLPIDIWTDYHKGSNNGKTFASSSIMNFEPGRSFTSNPLNQYILIDGGVMQAQDNVHSWGRRGTSNLRPKGLTVGTDGVELDKAAKLKFMKGGETATVQVSQPRDNVLQIEATGALILPSGTTAQQPTASTNTNGIRRNTDTAEIEVSNGVTWQGLGNTGIRKDTVSSSTDFTHAVDANTIIVAIHVNNSSGSAMPEFKIGTTLGNDDIRYTGELPTGWSDVLVWKPFHSSGTLYFGGVTGAITVEIYKIR